MRVTLLLADSAQAVSGKLYILGGGWSVIGPDPSPMAIAMMIEVPWDQTNMQHTWKLALFDDDGQPVMVPTPTGDRPVEFPATVEVGRPPGLKPGTSLAIPMAINFGPLPLRPGTSYVWRLTVNDKTNEDWRLPFTVRQRQV